MHQGDMCISLVSQEDFLTFSYARCVFSRCSQGRSSWGFLKEYVYFLGLSVSISLGYHKEDVHFLRCTREKCCASCLSEPSWNYRCDVYHFSWNHLLMCVLSGIVFSWAVRVCDCPVCVCLVPYHVDVCGWCVCVCAHVATWCVVCGCAQVCWGVCVLCEYPSAHDSSFPSNLCA